MAKTTISGQVEIKPSADGKIHISYIPKVSQMLMAGKEYEFVIDTTSAITYKEFYNKDRGLPEPKWGQKSHVLQCPNCGSQDMYYSGHPDDPEETLSDTVRCGRCGSITDWYEARKQLLNHPTDTPREVTKEPK